MPASSFLLASGHFLLYVHTSGLLYEYQTKPESGYLLSCDCKMTIGAASMWTSRMVIVICRRLAYTYTCAHVRIHANFVSLHSLTAQDRLYARSSRKVRLRLEV